MRSEGEPTCSTRLVTHSALEYCNIEGAGLAEHGFALPLSFSGAVNPEPD